MKAVLSVASTALVVAAAGGVALFHNGGSGSCDASFESTPTSAEQVAAMTRASERAAGSRSPKAGEPSRSTSSWTGPARQLLSDEEMGEIYLKVAQGDSLTIDELRALHTQRMIDKAAMFGRALRPQFQPDYTPGSFESRIAWSDLQTRFGGPMPVSESDLGDFMDALGKLRAELPFHIALEGITDHLSNDVSISGTPIIMSRSVTITDFGQGEVASPVFEYQGDADASFSIAITEAVPVLSDLSENVEVSGVQQFVFALDASTDLGMVDETIEFAAPTLTLAYNGTSSDQTLIDRFDADSSGDLSESERETLVREVLGEYRAERVESAVDITGDGAVDDAERQFYLERFEQGDPSADVNNDGEINQADLILFNNFLQTR